MKTTVFTLVLTLFVISSLAQDKNFDLSTYKTPFYKRQELNTTFNLSGHNNSYSIDQYQNGAIVQNKDYSFSNFESTININYYYIYNSRKKIIQFQSEFNPQYNYQSNKQGTNQTKITTTDLDFKFIGEADYYLTEDRFFLLVEPAFYMQPGYQKTESSSTNKEKSNYYNASLGIGAGLGRIEPVSDLWQSYYILKKLENKGLLDRGLSDDDIFEFAHTVTKLKNKRFFDFRLRKIAEMETLGSLTHQQGLISNNSIGYITTLNDYWNFANIPDRSAGRELTVKVTPRYSGSVSQTNDADKSKSHTTSILPAINFNCYKPLNLYWDRIVHFSVSENIILYQELAEAPSNFLGTNLQIGWQYYPNFRTIAGFNFRYHGQESSKLRNNVYVKYWMNRIGINANLTYYISPQLQIAGHISGYYNDKLESNNQSTNNQVDIQYGLNLSYAIF